jgi:hypothetical protein
MSLLAGQKTFLNLSFQPFVGKQLMQFASAVSHDAATDVFQVSAGIYVEGSTGLNQREKGGSCLATCFTSKEQPVFSADSKRTNRSFGRIVIHTRRGMLCVIFEVGNQGTKIAQLRCDVRGL